MGAAQLTCDLLARAWLDRRVIFIFITVDAEER